MDRLDDGFFALLSLYIGRDDLRDAFPEAFEGDIARLVQWVLVHGLTIDSSKNRLIPHEQSYKSYQSKNMKKLKLAIANFFKEHRVTIWDNSSEQYVKNNFKIYWETLHLVAHYQFDCVSGNPNLDLFAHTIKLIQNESAFQGRKIRCAMIGCSEITRPELPLFNSGLFEEITIFDIAQGLLDRQQLLVEKEGYDRIFYRYANLNEYQFSENSLEFIFAWGTVHHIENLEHFFAQARKALTTNGLIIMREYVGPNYIQLTDTQMTISDAILRLIPSEYRRRPDGSIKENGDRPNLKELLKVDPSESVRSQDILDALAAEFDVISLCKTGGTILHPLLNSIAGNFEKDERGAEILRTIIKIEKVLIEGGLLPSDYVYLVARRKG